MFVETKKRTMKPLYWILIIGAFLILLYGINAGWFGSTAKNTPPTTTGGGDVTLTVTSTH